MGRIYCASFLNGVSVMADLFQIKAAATTVVVLHEVRLTQGTSTSSSEQLPVVIRRLRGTVTQGSGGFSVTPIPLIPGSGAAVTAVVVCNPTKASGSLGHFTVRRGGENILNGWHWLFTPETRIVMAPGEYVCVSFDATPVAGASIWCGEVVLEELG
jgi:hypothetical protein